MKTAMKIIKPIVVLLVVVFGLVSLINAYQTIQSKPVKLVAKRQTYPLPRQTQLITAPAKAKVLVHVVETGECLSTIAEQYAWLGGRNWSKLHQANTGIKNPHLIKPGQKLVIPNAEASKPTATVLTSQQAKKVTERKVSQQAVVKATAGIFLWTVAGGNPFGKRNHRLALSQLPTDDPELVESLIKQYVTTKPHAGIVTPGTDFDWILFGNYTWIHTARWSGKSDLNALVWPEFEHKGRLWTITLTTLCNNLEISSRPKPPQLPPAEVIPPPAVQPPAEPPKKEQPSPTPPAEPPKKEQPSPTPPAKPCCSWKPDYKGSLFLAQRWGVNKPSTDTQTIYGGEMDFFPGYCGDDNRKFVPGASIKGVGWSGQFTEKNGGLLKFEGNQIVYGGVLEVRQPNDLSIFHARYGKQEGEAWNNTGYRGIEQNELINLEARHLHKTGHDWPSEVQVAGSGDLDIGGSKTSSVNGKALSAKDDPRRDQSQFAFMTQASWYASDNFEPLSGLVVDHTPAAKIVGVEPYIGAKVLGEQFEPSARYRINIGPDNPSDTTGFNLVWNFDRTFTKVGAYIANMWANRGVEDAQAAGLKRQPKTAVPIPDQPQRP